MNLIPITQAVKIKKKRVSSFEGEKGYLSTGDLNVNVIKKLVPITYENRPSRADLILDPGDLIVARMQATQKVILISENEADMIISTGFLTLEPKKGWDGEFLYFYLNSPFFQEQKDRLCTGATQKAINNTKFKEITIPEISLENQLKIVEKLRELDSLLKKRRESLLLMDEYLKSVFLEMFGDPVLNPKGWEKKKIGDISKVKIGPFGSLLHKEDYVQNGIPLVNPKHMIDGRVIPDPKNMISESKQAELSAYLLEKGDLIMARRGEIGRCAQITAEEDGYLCGTGSIYVRPKTSVDNNFLLFLFSTKAMTEFLEKQANGVTMLNLNANTIKKLEIITPDESSMFSFNSICNTTRQMKSRMKSQSEDLETSFKAMMQEAFTTNE